MHKRQIIRKIANELGYPESQVYKISQAFLAEITETIIQEERLELRGFGVFEVRKRKGKRIRDINTGKIKKVKPYKDVDFKTSSVIKRKL